MASQTLQGKVAVVGGASRNLGSLISKTLGGEGASVVVHYNSDSSKGPTEETADLKAELHEFAVDAGRTPQWVGAVHLPDQVTNFAAYRRASRP